MARKSVRVVAVDDDANMLRMLRGLLEHAPGFECGGCFPDGRQALTELQRVRPDLVLLDVCMPGMGGIECARHFRAAIPNLKIIMFTGMHDSETIDQCSNAGADAYLMKPVTAAQCLAEIKFVAARPHSSRPGERGFTLDGALSPADRLGLTLREGEVLRLLAQGLLYKEIGDHLGRSYSAVHKHQHKIFKKLRVSNRSEAIGKWHQAGGQ